MIWAAVILAVVFLAIRFSAFRWLILILGVVMVVIVTGYLINEKHEQEAAKQLVRKEQLELLDLQLGPQSYGTAYQLTGRVKNNSPHTVTGLQLKVSVQDCNEQKQCDTVGEEDERVYALIPPGQVRDVDQILYFSGIHVRGTFTWSYSITEIDAKP